MRVRVLSLLTEYDLKTWGLLCLMVISVGLIELVCAFYHNDKGLSAYIVMMGVFFCCFYSQGAMAGIMLARIITIDKEGEDTTSRC